MHYTQNQTSIFVFCYPLMSANANVKIVKLLLEVLESGATPDVHVENTTMRGYAAEKGWLEIVNSSIMSPSALATHSAT